MAKYLHPGVYIEEISSAARPLQAAGTSTAAFVGDTALDTVLPSVTNKALADTATLIKSWPEYQTRFGGIRPVKPVMVSGTDPGHITSPNVSKIIPANLGVVELKVKSGGLVNETTYEFTINGIVITETVPPGTTASDTVTILKNSIEDLSIPDLTVENGPPTTTTLKLSTSGSTDIMLSNISATEVGGTQLTDPSPGSIVPKGQIIGANAGNTTIEFALDTLTRTTTYSFTIDGQVFNLDFEAGKTPNDITSALVFAIGGTSLQAIASANVLTVNNPAITDVNFSEIVATYGSDDPDYMGHSVQAFFNNGGGRAYIYHNTASDYQDAMTALEDHRDISLLITPAKTPPTDSAITSHLTTMGNLMWLTHLAEGTPYLDAANNNAPTGHISGSYKALYYPWVEVSNPAYDPDIAGSKPSYFIPPTGFVAGNCAQTDRLYGVWHSPAGERTGLVGGLRAKTHITDSKQDELNPKHVNCIRSFNGPLKIWGTRTCHKGEWGYISVRRTAMMLEESIYQGMKWAVFRPNDHNLWTSLRQNIETFMSGLHDAGAFAGSKSSDAFFVRCGLGDTMTSAEVASGLVIVEIGFAPVYPAEFVVFRISQTQQIQA